MDHPTQQLSITEELITPATAERYLRHNANNRPLRPRRVAWFAKTIQHGHWQVTHQGIAFAASGRLLDGQHRLAAIARAGVAVPVMVTRGLEERAFTVIDTVAPRNYADHLATHGHGNHTILARVVRMQYEYELFDGDLARMASPENAPDFDDLEEVKNRHPRMVEIVTDPSASPYGVHFKAWRSLLTTTAICFLAYRFEQAHGVETTERFLQLLREGAPLEPDSIILRTRDRLYRMTAEKVATGAGRGNNDVLERMAIIITAWNRYVTGRELGAVGALKRHIVRGAKARPFPAIG